MSGVGVHVGTAHGERGAVVEQIELTKNTMSCGVALTAIKKSSMFWVSAEDNSSAVNY
jgi:hypothetical protein